MSGDERYKSRLGGRTHSCTSRKKASAFSLPWLGAAAAANRVGGDEKDRVAIASRFSRVSSACLCESPGVQCAPIQDQQYSEASGCGGR